MTRRERLEARLERRREWAEKRKAESNRRFDAAHQIVDSIPLGQPILVGHHSEKRHRAALNRMDNHMRAACESQDMAKHHESKAGGLADQLDRSIFSDDPDAPQALEAKALELEAKRDRMKAVNAAYRKSKGADHAARLVARVKAGSLTEAEALAAANLWRICPYHAGTPYPSYSLTNLGARIRQARERIKIVAARALRTEQAEAAGGTLIAGSGDYVSVTFSEKPERSILDALKAAGFHWSGGSWNGYRAKLPPEVSA